MARSSLSDSFIDLDLDVVIIFDNIFSHLVIIGSASLALDITSRLSDLINYRILNQSSLKSSIAKELSSDLQVSSKLL